MDKTLQMTCNSENWRGLSKDEFLDKVPRAAYLTLEECKDICAFLGLEFVSFPVGEDQTCEEWIRKTTIAERLISSVDPSVMAQDNVLGGIFLPRTLWIRSWHGKYVEAARFMGSLGSMVFYRDGYQPLIEPEELLGLLPAPFHTWDVSKRAASGVAVWGMLREVMPQLSNISAAMDFWADLYVEEEPLSKPLKSLIADFSKIDFPKTDSQKEFKTAYQQIAAQLGMCFCNIALRDNFLQKSGKDFTEKLAGQYPRTESTHDDWAENYGAKRVFWELQEWGQTQGNLSYYPIRPPILDPQVKADFTLWEEEYDQRTLPHILYQQIQEQIKFREEFEKSFAALGKNRRFPKKLMNGPTYDLVGRCEDYFENTRDAEDSPFFKSVEKLVESLENYDRDCPRFLLHGKTTIAVERDIREVDIWVHLKHASGGDTESAFLNINGAQIYEMEASVLWSTPKAGENPVLAMVDGYYFVPFKGDMASSAASFFWDLDAVCEECNMLAKVILFEALPSLGYECGIRPDGIVGGAGTGDEDPLFQFTADNSPESGFLAPFLEIHPSYRGKNLLDQILQGVLSVFEFICHSEFGTEHIVAHTLGNQLDKYLNPSPQKHEGWFGVPGVILLQVDGTEPEESETTIEAYGSAILAGKTKPKVKVVEMQKELRKRKLSAHFSKLYLDGAEIVIFDSTEFPMA